MNKTLITVIGFVLFIITMAYVMKQLQFYMRRYQEMSQGIITSEELTRKRYGPKFILKSVLAMLIFFVLMATISIVNGQLQ